MILRNVLRRFGAVVTERGSLFWLTYAGLVLLTVLFGGLLGVVLGYNIDLPQIEELQDVRPNVVSSVYSSDGSVIGEFALERRILVTFDQIPERLKQAILAAEDADFFEHSGIDFSRLMIEMVRNLWNHGLHYTRWKAASTLTMQLCKLRFTGSEKRLERKIKDWLFALKTEQNYSKEQILALYVNQIYLGHGVYGMAAAGEFYFNKPLASLSLSECALLAGILQVPSRFSPIRNPEAALARREYALNRLLDEGYISAEEKDEARREPLLPRGSRTHNLAPYFVEWVRQALERNYSAETIWKGGLRVYTTLDHDLQAVARRTMREGLKEFDKSHRPWEGSSRNVLDEKRSLEEYNNPEWRQVFDEGDMVMGLVMEVDRDSARVRFGKYMSQVVPKSVEWTGEEDLTRVFRVGDLAHFQIQKVDVEAQKLEVGLDRIPEVQGAMVVLDNKTGAIRAMVGGFDFELSQFNRVTQALRQPGSIFKPFTYLVALEEERSPHERVLDAPVSYLDAVGNLYEPKNSDEKFKGLIPMYQALAESRNVPTVRLARALGVGKIIEAVQRFGIHHEFLPVLSIALGSGETTLLELSSAFSAFPNSGVRAEPHYIVRVEDYEEVTQEEHRMRFEQATSPDIAARMVYLLRQVVLKGTARRANVLRKPVAGKTGTTNESTDVWFVGFTPDITAGVWVGYDEKKSLGEKIYGANLALPIWIEFMEAALENVPGRDFDNIYRPTPLEIALAEQQATRQIVARPIQVEEIPPPPRDRVSHGSTVLLFNLDTDEETTYRLVTREEADVKVGLISASSPLGRSLMGKQKGNVVVVVTPGGRDNFEIVELTTIYDPEEESAAGTAGTKGKAPQQSHRPPAG